MIEARGLFSFFLDQVFENADIFGLQNLDREDLARFSSARRTKQLSERSCVGSGASTGRFTFEGVGEFGKENGDHRIRR